MFLSCSWTNTSFILFWKKGRTSKKLIYKIHICEILILSLQFFFFFLCKFMSCSSFYVPLALILVLEFKVCVWAEFKAHNYGNFALYSLHFSRCTNYFNSRENFKFPSSSQKNIISYIIKERILYLLCTLPGRRPVTAEVSERARLGRVHLYFWGCLNGYNVFYTGH